MSYDTKSFRIREVLNYENYQYGEETHILVLPFKTLKKSGMTIKEFQIYLDLCYEADMNREYYRVVMY